MQRSRIIKKSRRKVMEYDYIDTQKVPPSKQEYLEVEKAHLTKLSSSSTPISRFQRIARGDWEISTNEQPRSSNDSRTPFQRSIPSKITWGVVQGVPCVFYPRGLRYLNPRALNELKEFADEFDFVLAADRRLKKTLVAHDRRRCFAMAITLGTSLLFRSPLVTAEQATDANVAAANIASGNGCG